MPCQPEDEVRLACKITGLSARSVKGEGWLSWTVQKLFTLLVPYHSQKSVMLYANKYTFAYKQGAVTVLSIMQRSTAAC